MHPVFESVDTFSVSEFDAWVRERERLGDAAHYELLNGRIVMVPPAGWPHGSIESNLVGELRDFVKAARLGRVFGSSQGFRLPSDDVVEPDVSFVSDERWGAAEPPAEGEYLRVVPELVIEIASPSTASRDRGEKLLIYSQNGVSEYWIVDYRLRRVSVWLNDDEGRLSGPAIYEGSGVSVPSRVLPGLALPLDEIFAA